MKNNMEQTIMIPETLEQCNNIPCSMCDYADNLHKGTTLKQACSTRMVLIKRTTKR